MKPVEFQEEAEDEFLDAVRYYAERSRRIATEFTEEAHRGINLIAEFPDASPEIRKSIRRKVFLKFPYSFVYAIEAERVLVLAVMRDGRRPEYWARRLEV